VARNTAVGVGRAEERDRGYPPPQPLKRRVWPALGIQPVLCEACRGTGLSEDLQDTARQLPTYLARNHSLSARRLMLVLVLYQQQPTTVLHIPDELRIGKLVTMYGPRLGPLGPPLLGPEARRSSMNSCHSLSIHPSASLPLPRPTPGLFN
jgi:hypothetical protein